MLKRILSLMLCFVLTLSLIGCEQDQPAADTPIAATEPTAVPTEPSFDIAAYKTAVENCSNEIFNSSITLTDVASYEVNYWESIEQLGGSAETEKITAAAWKWLAEEGACSQEDVASQYASIAALYKDIISTEISGDEAEEIKDLFDEYADAYISFYNLICSPSGAIDDFVNECNACIATIQNNKSKLDILCEAEEIVSPEPILNEDTEETEPPAEEDNATIGEKNALRAAKDYLDFTPFSYEGLIEQLEFEGYTNDEAVYAADNCGADWMDQAALCAIGYLEFTPFSYTGLIEQLEFEGFTTEQATHGANSCNADWNEQAVKCAENYLEFSAFSRDDLIEQLEFEGFTHDQAVYGVEANGY